MKLAAVILLASVVVAMAIPRGGFMLSRTAALVRRGDAQDPVWDGLVAYLSMETSGSTVIDNISTNTWTASAGATFSTNFGVRANGVDFNGTSGRIVDGRVVPSGSKTIAMWVNPDQAATQYFFTNYDGGSTSGFSILFNSTRRVGIAWTATINAVQSAAIPLDTWTHIACVFEAGATGGKVYVNGVLSSSGNLGTEAAGSNNVRLSGRWVTANTGDAVMFNGQMDEVPIWNRALSSNEVYRIATTPLYYTP